MFSLTGFPRQGVFHFLKGGQHHLLVGGQERLPIGPFDVDPGAALARIEDRRGKIGEKRDDRGRRQARGRAQAAPEVDRGILRGNRLREGGIGRLQVKPRRAHIGSTLEKGGRKAGMGQGRKLGQDPI